jgi:carboxyl-terminal processing protease
MSKAPHNNTQSVWLYFRLPASQDAGVLAAQKTMVEAWTIVQQTYVDQDFGGHDWDQELRESMTAAYKSTDGPQAFGQISSMLAKLGDPFTRIVPARYFG